MMGISVYRPAYILGDDKSVLYNAMIRYYTLKNKSQSISYHILREGAARDEWSASYVNTHDNLTKLMSKLIPMSEK